MVNRVLLERILSDIGSYVQDLNNSSDITWFVYQKDIRARRFVERTIHIIIEACIDVSQHIIADQKFREPASYHDTFKVLVENDILLPEDLDKFENIASFRNLIVHYYEKIDDEIVFGIFKNHLNDFKIFCKSISDFLQKQ